MGIRFLNLVVKCGDGLFSLHRIDPCAHLFYKSAAAAAVAAKKRITKPVSDELRLPPPVTKFKSNHINGLDLFARFGNNQILHSNGAGHTSVYDTSSDASVGFPIMDAPKGPHRVVVSSITRTMAHASSSGGWWDDLGMEHKTREEVAFFFRSKNGINTECLYVMDLAARGNPCYNFELLTCISDCWVWCPLPPPPFLDHPGYVPSIIPSCAVHSDGTTIYLSPSGFKEGDHGVGTYTFNTVTLEWRKASDCVLPFYGNAEYVPELGRWIGLSRCSPYHLCVLAPLDSPNVQYVWPDLDPPENLPLLDLTVVNLGDGRFCTVKYYDDPEKLHPVAVFTGVELQRSLGVSELEFINHKSKRYYGNNIKSVI